MSEKLVISMPNDFRVGETRLCRINGEWLHVEWWDSDTMVVEPGYARKIMFIERGRDLMNIVCTDVGAHDADMVLACA